MQQQGAENIYEGVMSTYNSEKRCLRALKSSKHFNVYNMEKYKI